MVIIISPKAIDIYGLRPILKLNEKYIFIYKNTLNFDKFKIKFYNFT